MSLHINFEPHSWYRGFAIKHDTDELIGCDNDEGDYYTNEGYIWEAYTDNGNTYCVDDLHADTLKELKQLITEYRKVTK